MKFNPIFDGRQEKLVMFDNGFNVPSFNKETEYHETNHSSFRRKKRSRFIPLDFPVALRIYNKNNSVPLDDVHRRVSDFFYSDGPKEFKIPNTNYYFIGEFDGPVEIPFNMNVIEYITVNFRSEYPYKFKDGVREQTASKTVTIDSDTQIPTIPLIELSGLTGNDVQISVSSDEFRRIRLSGNLPSNITIDIENETIFETNSGLDRISLLRYDSSFEDFKIKDGDVIVLTNSGSNAKAKLTYKELLL